jgi:uncharacterized protein
MKTQILIIHGGNTFSNRADYIRYLRTKNLSLDLIRKQDWKVSLQEKLGDDFDVLLPQMPNKNDSRYEDWKLWFERIVELLDDEVILIGHSLGGIFLAKYLSENPFKKKIVATFLLAAPFKLMDPVEDWLLPDSLSKFEEQAGKIFIYQSKDDQVVPFEESEKYKKAIPSAVPRVFESYKHFNQENFPELVEDIKRLK